MQMAVVFLTMVTLYRNLKKGFFTDKWVDVKGFGDKKNAEELLKILKGE